MTGATQVLWEIEMSAQSAAPVLQHSYQKAIRDSIHQPAVDGISNPRKGANHEKVVLAFVFRPLRIPVWPLIRVALSITRGRDLGKLPPWL
jgi:hypothetical protein